MQKNHSSFYQISLGQWSFNKTLFAGKMTNLDFPVRAKKEFDIDAVEYVNQFFMDKAEDKTYLSELLKRCNDNGVKNHLIMCDNEGPLADIDEKKRIQAVENHYKWVEAAKFLGCSIIRVNTFGEGSRDDLQKAAADGLTRLAEFAEKENINIVVENHGGHTSDGIWMAELMKMVNKKNVGTLPDFGNFCLQRDTGTMWEGKCIKWYDRYKGVSELMPFAKSVSAKTQDFNEQGDCVETDYYRMLKIVRDSGFHGYLGIEYGGNKWEEEDAIRKTKALIERAAETVAEFA